MFVTEDEAPRRPPPRRRRSPLNPVNNSNNTSVTRPKHDYDTSVLGSDDDDSSNNNTLASPRPTPQASPVNSTGVRIVIDRISSDDAEPISPTTLVRLRRLSMTVDASKTVGQPTSDPTTMVDPMVDPCTMVDRVRWPTRLIWSTRVQRSTRVQWST